MDLFFHAENDCSSKATDLLRQIERLAQPVMGVLCGGDYGGCAEASGVATAGALLGAGVGALVQTDRWQTVPLDRVRVTLTPARRGVGVAVSIGF